MYRDSSLALRMTAGGRHERNAGGCEKMEIISSQPFSMASFSVNDSQLPAGIVISSGGPAGMGGKDFGL